MLQPNEEMTWEEMVERYPGKWVFVEQTEGDVATIEKGIVKFVCTDKEMSKVWLDCRKKGLDYARARTTTPYNIGIISGLNCIIEAESVY